MKVKVTVGDVELALEGVTLTPRQISGFIVKCASIAVAMTSEEEAETKQALGFTAHLELDPERNLVEVDPEWFEEEAP
jgi:hypothetical protein